MNSYCSVALHIKHTRYMCVICALYVVTCRYMLNTKEMDSLGLGRLSPGQAAALPWPGGSSPLAGRQLSPGQAAALPCMARRQLSPGSSPLPRRQLSPGQAAAHPWPGRSSPGVRAASTHTCSAFDAELPAYHIRAPSPGHTRPSPGRCHIGC